MMDLDASQQALFASGALGVAYLVELDFVSATLYFTSFNKNLTIGGNTYLFAGDLLDVSAIKHSVDSDTQSVDVSLSVAKSALLAAALGNVEAYRGRQARVLLQPFDTQFRMVGAARLYFSGEMEPVRIDREVPPVDGGAAGGSIVMPISRVGLSRSRNQDPLRLTDTQQKSDYPGDRGFEGLRDLLENPTLWVSKRFQEFE